MKITSMLLLAFVLSSTACLNNGLAINEQNGVANQSGNGKTVNSNAGKLTANTTSSKTASPTQTNSKEVRKELPPVTAEQLQELLKNHFGDFLLIKSYKPFFVQGDFNGDKNQDIALVIGAQDRYGESGELTDIANGLCYAGADTSFQNLRTETFIAARPRQNCSVVEAKKKALRTEYSQYGLLVILSNQTGWRETLKQDAFGQKFLLLDAVFKAENQESSNEADKIIVVTKSQNKESQPVDINCLPAAAKGDGIFSGELEAGGKVIYFDGKKFAWTQCGD